MDLARADLAALCTLPNVTGLLENCSVKDLEPVEHVEKMLRPNNSWQDTQPTA